MSGARSASLEDAAEPLQFRGRPTGYRTAEGLQAMRRGVSNISVTTGYLQDAGCLSMNYELTLVMSYE